MSFTDLGTFLRRDITTGTLATAIEKDGIDGWDRYGRMKHYAPDSAEAQEALDLLADQAAYTGEPGVQSPLDRADMYPEAGFWRLGWLDENLPKFDEIAAGQMVDPRPQSTAKRQNADLAIIGSLLLFISGKIGTKRHPEFETEAKLIGLLTDKMAGYPGLSKRNLEDKFAQAKKVIDSS